MKKYNFILTKENAHILINRLNKMLERYGAIKSYAIYNGAKKGAYLLNSIGVKRDVLKITQTLDNFIHIDRKDEFKWHWEEMFHGEELIFNSDRSISFSFPLNSKMYITDNKISFINKTKTYSKEPRRGFTEIFEPFFNQGFAKDEIRFNEAMDDDYWDEYEREFKKEFENDYE